MGLMSQCFSVLTGMWHIHLMIVSSYLYNMYGFMNYNVEDENKVTKSALLSLTFSLPSVVNLSSTLSPRCLKFPRTPSLIFHQHFFKLLNRIPIYFLVLRMHLYKPYDHYYGAL